MLSGQTYSKWHNYMEPQLMFFQQINNELEKIEAQELKHEQDTPRFKIWEVKHKSNIQSLLNFISQNWNY